MHTPEPAPRRPTCDEIENLVREAADPLTSPIRLSAILDLADAPRMAYAASYATAQGGWSSKEQLEIALQRLATSTQQAAKSGIDKLLATIARNPNLSRAEWLRAMEVAPSAAAHNPLAKLLHIERNPILTKDFELLALGSLATHCVSDPSDTEARDLLVEIILAGLPETECFGSNFGEMESDVLPCGAANRYQWQGDHLWCLRSVAIHSAGNTIVDALGMMQASRTADALCACAILGEKLTMNEGAFWTARLNAIKVAPDGEDSFTHTLLTIADSEHGEEYQQPIAGWCVQDNPQAYIWLGRRPGFWPGVIHPHDAPIPPEISLLAHGYRITDHDQSGDANDLAIYRVRANDRQHDDEEDQETDHDQVCAFEDRVRDTDSVRMLSEGFAGEFGAVLLKAGCEFGRPFPNEEIERLRRIFGEDSWSVRFAQDPAASRCPECGRVALELIADQSCHACGFDPSDDD